MKTNFRLLLSLLILTVSACKKDKDPQPVTAAQAESWQKLKVSGADENFRAAHVHDGHAYFTSNGTLLKVDAAQNLQRFVLEENQEQHFLYEPSFSNNYLVQVNSGKTWLTIYDINNPKKKLYIPKDSLDNSVLDIDAIGNITESDQLMVGFTAINTSGSTKSAVSKLSFSSTGNSIQYTKQNDVIDSVSPVTNHASRIFGTANKHFVTPRYSDSRVYNHQNYDFYLNFRMSRVAEVNDTLYAGNFWDDRNDDALFISTDGGYNWQLLAQGARFDIFKFHSVDKKFVLSRQNQLYLFKIIHSENKAQLQELAIEGLFGKQEILDEINSIVVLGDLVYLATTRGIYYKKASDFFRLK